MNVRSTDLIQQGWPFFRGCRIIRPVSSGPEVLVPWRAGPVDVYLRDSSGVTADSGSPDYNYPALRIDDIGADGNAIVATDVVGLPFAWDSVREKAWGDCTANGLPSTGRDSGFDNMSGTNNLTGIDLSDIDGAGNPMQTIAIRFTTDFVSSQKILNAADASSTGFNISSSDKSSGRIVLQLVSAGTVVATLGGMAGLAASYAGVELEVIAAYDGTTLSCGLYVVGGSSTPIKTPSSTPGTGALSFAVHQSGVSFTAATSISKYRTWTTAIGAGAARDAIADGTTTSGWAEECDGIRTGVYLPSDLTKLYWRDGTGAPLTAGPL